MYAGELDDVNSLADTAAYLKLTERKIVELARARKLAAIKEGRRWVFPRAAITEYVARNTRPTDTPDPNPWGLTAGALRNVQRNRGFR